MAFSNGRIKATYSANVWDPFKQDHSVEYPMVNGELSQTFYYKAFEGLLP